MTAKNNNFVIAYWMLAVLFLGVALVRVAFFTPQEITMGLIQKIFYLHLPVAITTFLACLVNFLSSVGYLLNRQSWLDELADASARVAVVLCTVVLATGMIWAHSAWGQWWTWSPRLTFSLVLLLLYIVYVMVRASFERGQRRGVVSAVYAIIAFLDVPLVYLSVRLMPDMHPTSIGLDPAMRLTLAICFGPVLMIGAGLVYLRYQLNHLCTRQPEAATRPRPTRLIAEAL